MSRFLSRFPLSALLLVVAIGTAVGDAPRFEVTVLDAPDPAPAARMGPQMDPNGVPGAARMGPQMDPNGVR
jgi:hypothetical protein